jgi:ribosomal protein S27AE
MSYENEPQLDTYGENFRVCAYCGDVFVAHHGLQQYCHSKNGVANFCKHKQKALVDEKRLSERVIELERAKINILSPVDQNIEILKSIMGEAKEKNVTSDLLDTKGYSITAYSTRLLNNAKNVILRVGKYTVEWIGQNGAVHTFKITTT